MKITWQLQRLVRVIVVVSFVVCPTACTPSNDINTSQAHESAIESGLAAIVPAKQIESLFGEADHFITHFGFSRTQPCVWNSEFFIGDRYILTMQVDVMIDYTKNNIKEIMGPARFTIVEVESVLIESHGKVGTRFARQIDFGEREWASVVHANGNLNVLGIDLSENAPVKNFAKMVQARRQPRQASKK